jgi:hypothetical protein
VKFGCGEPESMLDGDLLTGIVPQWL